MRCAQCDAELEPKTLGGLCPVCLLDAALPDEGTEAAGEFHYDLIEEIGRKNPLLGRLVVGAASLIGRATCGALDLLRGDYHLVLRKI